MTGIWFWVIAAVVAGWMVQLYLTYQQSAAFNRAVTALRKQGTVSVGAGGRRYRGGRSIELDLRDRTQRAMFCGAYEPLETATVTRILQPGSTFIDV